MFWMPGGLKRPPIVCLMLLSMTSCCASGPANGLCSQVSPILISDEDKMTTETERQIRDLNNVWETQCES